MKADIIIIDDPHAHDEPVCTTEQLMAWFDAVPAPKYRPVPPPIRLSPDDVAAILATTSQPADERPAALKPDADR